MISIYSWGNASSFSFQRALGQGTLTPRVAPSLGGFQSGIPALAWSTDTGVHVQFLDLLGNYDTDPVTSRVTITTTPGATSVQVADALVGYGVVWQSGPEIHLRAVAQELGLFGTDIVVSANGHGVSLGAYSFTTSVPDPATPAKTLTADGFNVAWVEGAPGTLGPVWLQRYQVVNDATGHPSQVLAAGIDGQAEAFAIRTAGDQAALGTPGDGAVLIAASGRDPKVQGLHTGETLVTWIGADNAVHARLYPPNGVAVPSDEAVNGYTQAIYDAVNASLATLGTVAPGGKVQIAELGPGNFAVVWQTATGLDGFVFAVPPDGPAGAGLAAGWTRYDIAGFSIDGFTGDFAITGFGEDNTNLAISYVGSDGGGTGVFARVIDVTGINGQPDSLSTGPQARINVDVAGDQSLVGITGLVSDRFMVAYVDEAGVIQTRILDTRAPGQLLVGDRVVDRNGNGVIDANDRIRALPDVIVGTNGDDVVIGDRIDPTGLIAGVRFDDPLGDDDEIHGGLGADILFGGGGVDIIDGGLDLSTGGLPDPDPIFAGATARTFLDKAIYQGNAITYDITISGDGSYTIIDARFDDGANILDRLANGTLNVDGLDYVANVELLQFLNGDLADLRKATYAASLADAKAALAAAELAHPSFSMAGYYQIADQDHRLTGNVAVLPDGTPGGADLAPAGLETVTTPVGWALSSQAVAGAGFGVATGAAQQVAPILAPNIDGFVAAWEEPGRAGAVLLKMQVIDAIGAATPVAGGPGVTIGVTDDAAAGTAAISATGVGSVAAWLSASTGALRLQAYDVDNVALGDTLTLAPATPGAVIADVAVSSQSLATGALPEQFTVSWIEGADAQGFGTLTAQRFGFPTLNGIDQPPVALGRDGVEGGVDDAAFVIDTGARAPAVTGLHDGETAISYVKAGPAGDVIAVKVLRPDGSLAIDTTLPLAAGVQGVPSIAGVGAGDFVVGYATQAGGVTDGGVAIFRFAKGWTQPEIVDLDIPADARDVAYAIAGDAELTIIATWREPDGDMVGQRYSYGGDLVGGVLVGHKEGALFTVATATGASAATGLVDGRFATLFTQPSATGDSDVVARIFDTRDASDPVIGRIAGGARDFLVGTIFDDVLDGRDREDVLYGALGNDVLIGGVNDDELHGGAGNDDLFGGSGTDVLSGDEGDDLLTGGYGRDYISGGAGIDTLSYANEFRPVAVDLAAGTVRSAPASNAVLLPDPGGLTIQGDAALVNAIFNDAGLEDVLGNLVEVNHAAGIFSVDRNHGIENIVGSRGNDTLSGDTGDNVITGGGGDDVIDGRGGQDTVVYAGPASRYVITQVGTATYRVVDRLGEETTAAGDTLTGIERLRFADGEVAPPQNPVPVVSGPVALAALAEDQTRRITAADLLVGATNPAGGPLSVVGLTVNRGAVTANADGSWTYTPLANDDTAATFSYFVTGAVAQVAQTATLDLTPVNDATTGSVTLGLAGTTGLQVGQTLADVDGFTRAVTYLWQVSADRGATWTTVANVTGAAFTAPGSNAGQFVRVAAVTADVFGAISVAAGTLAIVGNANGNTLTGTAAGDIVIGNGGNDVLDGAAGADTMAGGAGNDVYRVDSIGDVVVEAAGAGTDRVETTLSAYRLADNVETLTFTGTGAFTGTGNALANTITGGAGNDVFKASGNGDGNDRYEGGGGTDTVDYGAMTNAVTVSLAAGTATSNNSSDTLVSIENAIGGSGADRFIAATGRNVFTGGAGNDTFVFGSTASAGLGSTRDVITDFQPGDRIDVSGIDADTRLNRDQAFAFAGEKAGAGQVAAGQIGFFYDAANGVTVVEGNVATGNNDATVDFQVQLAGRVTLSALDFVL